MDFDAIKQAAEGRWTEVIPRLTPLSAEIFERKSQDHPCPRCNGKSVIWPGLDATKTGSIACRKCTSNKPTGDGIATVAFFAGCSQGEAAKRIADCLGLPVNGSKPQPTTPDELIAQLCRDKRMPIEAFKQFEPKVGKRGRGAKRVIRVPIYNEKGEKHSHFDFAPGEKGWFAKGVGMAGLFLPGRKPAQGETWLMVEGGKDAAALVGLGHNAVGLPTCEMNAKYAGLFRGCHVIIVHDLDTSGQSGAQRSGGRLVGIAASVKIARLPGEILEKGGMDVRDILAQADGERLVQDAIANATPWKPRPGESTYADSRPEVLVTNEYEYGRVCDEVCKHLGKLGVDSPWIPQSDREQLAIYQRGGSLVHVIFQDDSETLAGIDLARGTPRIRLLPPGQIPLRITDACRLIREVVTAENEIQRKPAYPEPWLSNGVFSRGDWGNWIRRLEGVVTSPTLRRDGSILQRPGYDDQTKLIFSPNIEFPQVPETPTIEDAKAAIEALLDVVSDFYFLDDSDKSAWLCLVLTLIGRPSIEGCTPLFAITAPTRGSGKSKLADVASLIAFGRTAPRKIYSRHDEEQRKAITATAIEALPAVLFDNVDGELGGPSLDAAITATTWIDRVLQSSKTTGELPLLTVWSATGNNLRFGSDLARRVLPIRLSTKCENPEDRTDFVHADLLSWVREHRAELAINALTILRAYFAAGRPEQSGGTWGSFESWSNVVRGSLVWAGLPDPLLTRETAREEDNNGKIVHGLIAGLLELGTDALEGVTAKEIVEIIEDAAITRDIETLRAVVHEIASNEKGKIDSRRLAYKLRDNKGRIVRVFKSDGKQFDDYKLLSKPGRSGVLKWMVERVNFGGDGGDGCDTFEPLESRNVCVQDF